MLTFVETSGPAGATGAGAGAGGGGGGQQQRCFFPQPPWTAVRLVEAIDSKDDWAVVRMVTR